MEALPNFRVDTARTGSRTTVKLAGELDSATYPELIAAFDRLLEAGPGDELVLDLADVSFVDSAGMRAIIMIERRSGERGISMVIRPASGPVTDLLQMTGLGHRIAVAPREDTPSTSEPFLERIELELPREPTTPGLARRELRAAIAGRLDEADRATATLLTSELVTNAVIHPDPGATDPVGLRITSYPDRIRVEVSDAGTGFDAASLTPRPREAGGHGLVVVDQLSSRWGTRRTTLRGGLGFCVWFELDVASAWADAEPSETAAGDAQPSETTAAATAAEA